ncbi:hypothetical protein DFH06DRAFT_652534 [Mycena polygramma]|nr:hypothetical protein DFH06DRAFT_652534 [Mycena polygramma]
MGQTRGVGRRTRRIESEPSRMAWLCVVEGARPRPYPSASGPRVQRRISRVCKHSHPAYLQSQASASKEYSAPRRFDLHRSDLSYMLRAGRSHLSYSSLDQLLLTRRLGIFRSWTILINAEYGKKCTLVCLFNSRLHSVQTRPRLSRALFAAAASTTRYWYCFVSAHASNVTLDGRVSPPQSAARRQAAPTNSRGGGLFLGWINELQSPPRFKFGSFFPLRNTARHRHGHSISGLRPAHVLQSHPRFSSSCFSSLRTWRPRGAFASTIR